MTALTWREIVERDDIVGGDLETVEDNVVYRGPIKKIEMTGDNAIRITLEWAARLDPETLIWEKWDNIAEAFADDEFNPPQDIGNGRIYYIYPYVGRATIFPRGGSKLDPTKVKGL